MARLGSVPDIRPSVATHIVGPLPDDTVTARRHRKRPVLLVSQFRVDASNDEEHTPLRMTPQRNLA